MSFLFCMILDNTGMLDNLFCVIVLYYVYEYCFFVSDDVIVSLLTALPPSKATLRNVFEKAIDLPYLCDRLHIPDDKRDVDSAIEYYAQDTDQMKMRKMIFWLDYMGDTALADSVMEFAEPPAGMATKYSREHNTSLACNVCVCL